MEIDSYLQAIKNNPQDYTAHWNLARALAKKGRWSKAIEVYQRALKLADNLKEGSVEAKANIFHYWGDALINLERWDEAVGAYNKAIKLKSDFSWSYHNLGIALFNLELLEDAIDFFGRAIKVDPNFVVSYYYLGDAFTKQEKLEEAINVYRKAHELNPNFSDVSDKLASVLLKRADRDLDFALSLYQETAVNGEYNPNMVSILVKQNKLDEAVNSILGLKTVTLDVLAKMEKIVWQRSQQYEPTFQFEVSDRSYAIWRQKNSPDIEDLRRMCRRVSKLIYKPKISIIFPLDESNVSWFTESISFIKEQVYPNWELCLVFTTARDPFVEVNSQLKTIVESHSNGDRRIKINGLDLENIDLANSAIDMAVGEFILFLQPGTILAPNALAECVFELERNSNSDIIYSDEDRIVGGQLCQPWFKPDWNRDLLLSRNYFGSLILCRTSLVRDLGGLRKTFPNAYYYDLILRLTEKTNNITHIPHILAHNNSEISSENNLEVVRIITDALERRDEVGKVISDRVYPEIKTIRYLIKEDALISIIIPTKNKGRMLNKCLDSIFNLSTYPHYEIIIVDNGSDEIDTLEVLSDWQNQYPQKFKVINLDIPFNYSRLNNLAVAESRGKYLLFLNNDTLVISPDWLEGMLEQAQRSSIGAVGSLLLYKNDTIQHAGVILGVNGIAGHSHRNFSHNDSGYYQSLLSTANYSAVTAACMMCRKSLFNEVGGFNEDLAVAYNDVDFCLKLQDKGYKNILLPHVKLYHYESLTRTPEDTPEKQARIQQEVSYMKNRWGKWIEKDPYYNINLTRKSEDYSYNLDKKTEVIGIIYRRVPEEILFGFFCDIPKLGNVEDNILYIEGWILGNVAKAVTVEAILDGKVLNSTPLSIERLDVGKAYSNLLGAKDSGFAFNVELKDLPKNPEIDLRVTLTNNTNVEFARIQLNG